MIPIYEQGDGRGIGYVLEHFKDRLEEICAEHKQNNRAQGFAFILRDAEDRSLNKILKDQGAFTKLDRLSGDRLSVFFIHTSSPGALAKFNERVIGQAGLENPHLPAVVFFRAAINERSEFGLTDARLVPLDNANMIHGLQELYDNIESYIGEMDEPKSDEGSSRMVIRVGKFLSLEMFSAALGGLFSRYIG